MKIFFWQHTFFCSHKFHKIEHYFTFVKQKIRDPEKTYSGSRIQGSKRHRIPDPDPQHWIPVSIITVWRIRIDLMRIRILIHHFFSLRICIQGPGSKPPLPPPPPASAVCARYSISQ
jgi:hypothetical protein